MMHSPHTITDFRDLAGKNVIYATSADVEMLGGKPHTFPKSGTVFSATEDSIIVGGAEIQRTDLVELYVP